MHSLTIILGAGDRPSTFEAAMFFRRFFSTPPDKKIARELYSLIVAKARQPYFYAELHVPDTVDGRFDMIALHVILVVNRLVQGGSAAKSLSQKLFDEMFTDMDHSLREMGVSDLGLAKRVRTMAGAFYGRAKAYREAIEKNDAEALKSALLRNAYAGTAEPRVVSRLAAYVLAAAGALAAHSEEDMIAGRVSFADPEGCK
jgi:cytochrome b pre-mRNA-processing protein 3